MIYLNHTELKICFSLDKLIRAKLHSWEYELDLKVFQEQIKTGKTKHGYIIPKNKLRYMKKQFAQRDIEKFPLIPCYGADGSYGACPKTFQVFNDIAIIKAVHKYTDCVIQFDSEYKVNPLISEPYSGYCIEGKELKNLRMWNEWSEKDALQEKFIYSFTAYSIGQSIVVKNTLTGNESNITDYDDW